MRRKEACSIKFKAVAEGDDVFIEGWASKTTVDRDNEFIRPGQFLLDNFAKNPMMLFNHDKDKPVGKWVHWEQREEGLWVKGKLSRSQTPMVQYVRDLVAEGMLNSLSIGFDEKDQEQYSSGEIELLDVELYEISIVSIPAHQDAQFGVSAKALGGARSLAGARSLVLKEKGAALASRLNERLDQIGESAQTLAEDLATDEAEYAAVTAVLAGTQEPSPDLLAAIATALGLDVAELSKLDGDQSPEAGASAPEGDSAVKSMPKVETHSVYVPKAVCEKAEQAAEMVKTAGWKADLVVDEGDYWKFGQHDEDQFDMGDLSQVDLGDDCYAMVGKMKPAKTEGDPQAAPAADAPPPPANANPEEKPADPEVKKDVAQPEQEAACKACVDKTTAAMKAEGKSDEEAAAASKDACAKECTGKIEGAAPQPTDPVPPPTDAAPAAKQAGTQVDTPISGSSSDNMNENPLLAGIQQGIALLGQLVAEIQKLGEKIDSLVTQEQAEVDEPVDPAVIKGLADRIDAVSKSFSE